jgi:hypothetical protein
MSGKYIVFIILGLMVANIIGVLPTASMFWLLMLLFAAICVRMMVNGLLALFGREREETPVEVHHHHVYVYNEQGESADDDKAD